MLTVEPAQPSTVEGIGDDLTGSASADILRGGAGNDILDGGAGVDRMLFGAGEVGVDNQDTIDNYVGTGANRDLIDVSALLDATFSDGNNIANFVQITDTGADAQVSIDATGTGNFTNAGNVATLSGQARSAVS